MPSTTNAFFPFATRSLMLSSEVKLMGTFSFVAGTDFHWVDTLRGKTVAYFPTRQARHFDGERCTDTGE